MSPQTEGSRGNDFRVQHHLIYALWLCKPSKPSYGYKHTQHHSRNCEPVLVFWGNCRFVDSLPRVVTGHPLLFLVLTAALQRCEDQSPLVCGRLFPPLFVVRHLMFFRLHLHVSRGLGSCTHMQAQVTQAHTCTQRMCKAQGHKRNKCVSTWRTSGSYKIQWFLISIGKSPFWSSNVKYTEVQLPWKSVQA